ncbi:hypothetical protein [Sphingomicrobium lutaoense]|uniref:Uncharacterized protein n=1 Tax=Sphingomicrobium lutaoense TaxID=515949 RepID=A0A839YVH5_9SPHN|nr:hypothetical protein [Sphingomicrobium lutaoense]MBB3763209.1 hypothetical protein [Sphingomicrobium lutaoense]
MSIYLTNPNGSGTVRLYTTPRKASIGALDLKPGGGEVAIVERAGSVISLKLLSYNDNGSLIGSPRVIPTSCVATKVDYQPISSDPLLLVTESCVDGSKISTVRRDGTGYQTVMETVSNPILDHARWLHDGSNFIYVLFEASPSSVPYKLCRLDCVESAGNLLWTSNTDLSWVDVARTSNTVLFTAGVSTTGVYIHRLNIDTGEILKTFIHGTDGHFSPDDRKVLYETPYAAKGTYLDIHDTMGPSARITPKGDYGPKDWRL